MRTLRHSGSVILSWLFLTLLFAGAAGQAAGDSPVAAAAKDGDLRAVRTLIAKKANVNEPARDGSTALLWAVYHSNLEMAQALIAAGASVNTANKYGVTPLIQASRTGDTPVIDALLKAGATVSLAHPDGETPVMAAARTGRAEAVRLLVEAGATVSMAHPDGETPVMAAARSGRVEAVRLLVEAGADVNALSYQQETALMWAAAEGHADVVKTLLAANADPNLKARITTLKERKHADHPTGGMTALMYAARNGQEGAVRALMAGGADPKLTNGDGVTAMAIAVVNDRFDLAKVMLDLGADANDGSLYFAIDMHDATTDMRARDGSRLRADHPNRLNALDLAKALLERGADPNKAFVGQLHSNTLCCGEEINASPFFRAAVASDVEALKLMLAHGAQVEWTPTAVKREGRGGAAGGGGRGGGNVGRTPIMLAMTGGRGAAFAAGPGFERLGPPPFREAANREPLEAVNVLLAAGANPNVKAPDGSTPLHQAVTARNIGIIRALVAAGAKLDAVNRDNLTPLQVAEKPDPPPPPGNNNDSRAYRPKRDTREDVIAAVRELMGLGPNDPTPQPPPAPKPAEGEKKTEDAEDAA
jgi:ankyrin repeat protein